MVIVTTPTATTYSGYVILAATNVSPTIEELTGFRRFYPFELIISEAFTSTNNTTQLAISDVADPYATNYPLVDRLNKAITGEELVGYAGKRRCIHCVYDNVFKVVKVCSCICPVTLTVPTTTSTGG
jgi:hypothetical protein